MKTTRLWICLIVLLTSLFPCTMIPAWAAGGFDDALKLYWQGKTPEALESIRAYQKKYPDDTEARLWKTIIRMELAIELENVDRDTSGRIALSEWGTFWDANPLDENSETAIGGLWLYKVAEAKVYWLNNRRPRSYRAMKEISNSKAPAPEALHFKGVMEYEGYLASPFAMDPADRNASVEEAARSFTAELAQIGKASPEESLRAAYWLAKSTCGRDRWTSPAKLSAIFSGVDVDLPGSNYSPLAKDMIGKGCPKR